LYPPRSFILYIETCEGKVTLEILRSRIFFFLISRAHSILTSGLFPARVSLAPVLTYSLIPTVFLVPVTSSQNICDTNSFNWPPVCKNCVLNPVPRVGHYLRFMHTYSFSYTGCGQQYHRVFQIVIKAFWVSTYPVENLHSHSSIQMKTTVVRVMTNLRWLLQFRRNLLPPYSCLEA